MEEEKLPIGVKIIGVLLLIIGAICLLISPVLLIGMGLSHGASTSNNLLRVFLVFLFGIVSIIVSIFILKKRNWARWASISLFLIAFIFNLTTNTEPMVQLFSAITRINLIEGFDLIPQIRYISLAVVLLINLSIVAYLIFNKKVRNVFNGNN